jgi:3-oxoadipate enol-lactonase
MAETTSAGCRLSYDVAGPAGAPALLLSHALGTNRTLWDPQMDALSTSYRVVRYDVRGHGTSGAPAGEYSIDQLGRDALAILDAEGIMRAHVCGLSLGGLTAIWLAHAVPARTGRIVLANTSARIGAPAIWQDRVDLVTSQGLAPVGESAPQRWFTAAYGAAHPEVIAQCRAMLLGCSPSGYAGCVAALRDTDLRPILGKIASPALVITGRWDPVTPPADGQVIAAGLPGARVLDLDAAHFSNIEAAAAFTEAVRRFLAE